VKIIYIRRKFAVGREFSSGIFRFLRNPAIARHKISKNHPPATFFASFCG
jgi:hypothetical protein